MRQLKRYKKLILIILILFAIVPPIFKTDKSERVYFYKNICYQNDCFHYEIADSSGTRQLWLMFRKTLPIQSWMLFVFPNSSINKFWMKNTIIPLDIIRLDKDFTIQYINRNTPWCEGSKCPSYWPNKLSKYVLELNSWQSENWQVWENLIFR